MNRFITLGATAFAFSGIILSTTAAEMVKRPLMVLELPPCPQQISRDNFRDLCRNKAAAKILKKSNYGKTTVGNALLVDTHNSCHEVHAIMKKITKRGNVMYNLVNDVGNHCTYQVDNKQYTFQVKHAGPSAAHPDAAGIQNPQKPLEQAHEAQPPAASWEPNEGQLVKAGQEVMDLKRENENINPSREAMVARLQTKMSISEAQAIKILDELGVE